MASLSFDDVLLVPQYSDIESRTVLSTKNSLGDIGLDLPIISSPMDTVTELDMLVAMEMNGGLGIIHRYNSIDDQSKLVKQAKVVEVDNVGAAIGVTGDYLERAQALYDEDCPYQPTGSVWRLGASHGWQCCDRRGCQCSC
jgi:IMP dehydrogenase